MCCFFFNHHNPAEHLLLSLFFVVIETQELAQKEALAWEGYAGAVGNEQDEATRALRRADGLLVRTTL